MRHDLWAIPGGSILLHIRLGGILLDHPVRIEKRRIERDRLPHDIDPSFSVLIKHRDDHRSQLVI
jgi:hypothetical protein